MRSQCDSAALGLATEATEESSAALYPARSTPPNTIHAPSQPGTIGAGKRQKVRKALGSIRRYGWRSLLEPTRTRLAIRRALAALSTFPTCGHFPRRTQFVARPSQTKNYASRTSNGRRRQD